MAKLASSAALVGLCITLTLLASAPPALPRALPAAAPLCPRPLEKCDLYFNRPTVPKVYVRANISNVLLTHAPVYTIDGKYVQTLGISGCHFYAGAGAGCKGFGFFPPDPNTNITNILGTYPMLPALAKNLQNRCVILTIDNFFVSGVGWINRGDNQPHYTANRRCLVIHT